MSDRFTPTPEDRFTFVRAALEDEAAVRDAVSQVDSRTTRCPRKSPAGSAGSGINAFSEPSSALPTTIPLISPLFAPESGNPAPT